MTEIQIVAPQLRLDCSLSHRLALRPGKIVANKEIFVQILPILACFLVVLCSGCQAEERHSLNTIKQTRTFCVGRHLIDMPAGFKLAMPITGSFDVHSEDDSASSTDITVLADSVAPETFAAALEKRRSELIASSGKSTDILKAVLTKGSDSSLFRILEIKDSYTSELHLLKGDLHLKAEAQSYHGQYEEAERQLVAFANGIVPAQASSAPKSGFCLGPVTVPGVYETEFSSFTFRSEESPDILITIDINTYTLDERAKLLQRVDGPGSLLQIFDAQNKVLRKGNLKVAGMDAQEWLGWVKLGKNRDKIQYGFALETYRPNPGPAYPHIHLELDTGQHDKNGVQQPNSLTDQQAIALWDSIVTSIRLRPDMSQ